MITLAEYFSKHGEPPDQVKINALDLLAKVCALLQEVPYPEAKKPKVNSGWRPAEYNRSVANAAPNSKHITGQAVDLADPEGSIDEYLFEHPELLEKHQLWCEHPASTRRWVHFQSVPPRSGKRHFFP